MLGLRLELTILAHKWDYCTWLSTREITKKLKSASSINSA